MLIQLSFSYWGKPSNTSFLILMLSGRLHCLEMLVIHWVPAVLLSHPEWKGPDPCGCGARSSGRDLGDGRVGRHGQGAALAAEADATPPRLPAAPHAAASSPSPSLGQGQGAAGRHGAATWPVCGDRRTEGRRSFVVIRCLLVTSDFREAALQ